MSIRQRVAVDFYGIARNFALFFTVLLASCFALSTFEILAFLKQTILFLLFACAFLWGAFYLAWFWRRPLTIFSIYTAQGTAGDLLQRASSVSFQRVEQVSLKWMLKQYCRAE